MKRWTLKNSSCSTPSSKSPSSSSIKPYFTLHAFIKSKMVIATNVQIQWLVLVEILSCEDLVCEHFNYMCLISNINLKRNIEQLQVFNNTITYTTCKFNWHMIESKVNIIWVYLNLKKPCFAYCCAFCNQPNMFKTKKIITQTNSTWLQYNNDKGSHNPKIDQQG